ncbi:neutral/alkaline non-lysosomal ceramidase N-terminal domain-containing protein [Pseudenhygromyxa sp. WMMC2535]|uniref:neutral/alkaline non-lysosomal ceramidase N-terminal domain-containing protein n=1 Tax=Pseudenhygromyxa sp. WMMC2535 TaxID=2712867 RepID=UPI001556316A|nr:neutral/alkaline non-lysosomal ceramidase N-terminal domain-containing protein [Pseudenhygromyxa sp. WMMC2535]NVB40915.1 neutral/alkaline non-lysosomal ceramidase N-terminal domain-containing protein [Pseudenhygromyxa sp. WMMC2535]
MSSLARSRVNFVRSTLIGLLASPWLIAGCSDDAGGGDPSEESGADEVETSAGTGADTGTEQGTGAETSAGSEDSETGDPPFEGELPESWCPGGPSGACDEVEGAPLRAGVAVLDMVPECFESWTDVAQNGDYDEGEDDFDDCGCDRLCPADVGYQGPDEGEGDGVFQRAWLAGFQNNRPASGVRGAELGLVGEGDGIWCRAVVLDQGNTRVAIVSIDTIGYFYDEVKAVAELVADQDIDWLLVSSIHDHEGPDTMGMWGESIGVSGFDADYRAQVRTTIAAAVTEATAGLREVGTMTVGRGDASTANLGDADKGIRNVNNDKRDPFVIDEAVDVLHLADTEGETIATLINYASHPESLADENTLYSADYVHALRRTVEQGSTWTSAEGKAGLGGSAVFLSGALGGMMTPLGIDTATPDGDVWSTGQFEKADAIGQLVGEVALDALQNGEVIEDPQLQFATQSFLVEVVNEGFRLLFITGVLEREVVEDEGGKQYVRSEMGVIELGPLRMLSVPGELLPELAVGGYDGSQMFTSEVELIDPNNTNPPDLSQAPEGPYLKDIIASPYTWVIGLGNDELGYIIPEYDFVLGFPAYISEAEGDHYEETNSIGPHMTGLVYEHGEQLSEFIDWL